MIEVITGSNYNQIVTLKLLHFLVERIVLLPLIIIFESQNNEFDFL